LLPAVLLTALASGCLQAPPPRAATEQRSSAGGSIVQGDRCLGAPADLTLDPGTAPAPEYVNDIRLGYSRGGGVFLSRPLCEMHGDALCRFVEAHERGHHYTHTIGPQSKCAEVLADCWAAIHSDDEALEAALQFFASRHGSAGHYEEPRRRAQTVLECATHRHRRHLASTRPSAAPAAPALTF
jgi:hypothetical protein